MLFLYSFLLLSLLPSSLRKRYMDMNEAGEMAQQGRPPTALSENPGLIPSTHKMTHTLCNSSSRRQVKGIGLTDRGLCRFYYSFENIGNLRKAAFEVSNVAVQTLVIKKGPVASWHSILPRLCSLQQRVRVVLTSLFALASPGEGSGMLSRIRNTSLSV